MLNVGILVFPFIEELDFIGPFEVLNYVNKNKLKSVIRKFKFPNDE